MKLKALGICGSLRRHSCNAGMLRAAQRLVPAGVSLEIADLSDIPFFNADIEIMPEPVARVLAQMAEAKCFVFASPEYNFSIAPALKNILDWASRAPDNQLLADKPVAIMGARGGIPESPAQRHLMDVCSFLRLRILVTPQVTANVFGGSFDARGNLTDRHIALLIREQMNALAVLCRRRSAKQRPQDHSWQPSRSAPTPPLPPSGFARPSPAF